MRLLFVGTGAADWPMEYSGDLSAAARGEVRGCASLLVDGRVLVDCGPTVPAALRMLGVPLAQIEDVLVTHSHGDHFDVSALAGIATARGGAPPLRVWADAGAAARCPQTADLEVRPLAAHAQVQGGGIAVTALPANHEVAAAEQALHFLLDQDGARCLYATDGAWLLRETWAALRERPLAALIWDGTIGETAGDWRIYEHNSVDMVRVMLQTLRQYGVVGEHTQVLLTHLARTLCAPHDQMAARLAAEGLVPAHDGMVVKL
jgi:ribonuclease BN (tRNA processing enzyme)